MGIRGLAIRGIGVCLATVAIVVSGCSKSSQTTTGAQASAAPSASSATPTPVPTTAAVLTPPAGWNPASPMPAGVLGAWVRPGNEALVQNISLLGEPFTGTLDEFVAERAKVERNTFGGLTQESSQDIFICNDHPARMIKWSGTRNGNDYAFEQVYTIWNKTGPTAYVATYTRSASDLELPEATTSISSICAP